MERKVGSIFAYDLNTILRVEKVESDINKCIKCWYFEINNYKNPEYTCDKYYIIKYRGECFRLRRNDRKPVIFKKIDIHVSLYICRLMIKNKNL